MKIESKGLGSVVQTWLHPALQCVCVYVCVCYIKITAKERQLRSKGEGHQQWRQPASYRKGSGLEMHAFLKLVLASCKESSSPLPIYTLPCSCASWDWTHPSKAHNLSGSGGRGTSALPGWPISPSVASVLPVSGKAQPLDCTLTTTVLHCHYMIPMTSFFSHLQK